MKTYSPYYGSAREVPCHLQHTLTGTSGITGPSIHHSTLTGSRDQEVA